MGLDKYWDLYLALACFYAILFASMLSRHMRRSMWQRSLGDWFLDLQGLLLQGWLVPLAKSYGLIWLLMWGLPSLRGAVHLHPILAFLVAFVAVDYAYYWNHRYLHRSPLWPFHRVHHAAQQLDIFTSARNSLWTPLLLVYIWLHTLFVYVLANPFPYLLGATLTAAFDLWRHSPTLSLKRFSLFKNLNWIIITPDEHAWHHSAQGMNYNYGANFSLWDRLHGTFQEKGRRHVKYGWKESRTALQQWLRPWITR